MNEAVALLAYAIVAGTAGGALLRRAAWTSRGPRLGVAAWQVLSISVLGSLLLAGLAMIVPSDVVSTNLAELLDACVMALRAQYSTPGGALLHAASATTTIVLAARVAYLLVAGLRRARRSSEEHLSQLRLAAHRDPRLDALVVDHPTAAVYCLPGRPGGAGGPGTVVLTSAAISTLSDEELTAVLAHERAHLSGRHHLLAAAAAAMSRAVPFLPVFGWARTEQARLLEMVADDQAADQGTRLDVARALVRLAEGAVPGVALGAADVTAWPAWSVCLSRPTAWVGPRRARSR